MRTLFSTTFNSTKSHGLTAAKSATGAISPTAAAAYAILATQNQTDTQGSVEQRIKNCMQLSHDTLQISEQLNEINDSRPSYSFVKG